MIHYPLIISHSGPLSQFWCMIFEAKHKELKETAHSITSRKNITFTLALKQQLQLSYRLLGTTKNMYSSNIDLGPIIQLPQETIALYNNQITYNISTPSFDFCKDNIIFLSWIRLKGILYNTKNMSIILCLSEEANCMLPTFGIIESLFINNLNKPFAICKQFNTLYFDDHFQAFNVTLTTNLICISLENLECVYPTHHCNTSSGLTFISLKL